MDLLDERAGLRRIAAEIFVARRETREFPKRLVVPQRHPERQRTPERKAENPGICRIGERAIAADGVVDERLQIIDQKVRRLRSIDLRGKLDVTLAEIFAMKNGHQNQLLELPRRHQISHPTIRGDGFISGRLQRLQRVLPVEEVKHRMPRIARRHVSRWQPNADPPRAAELRGVQFALDRLSVDEVVIPRLRVLPVFHLDGHVQIMRDEILVIEAGRTVLVSLLRRPGTPRDLKLHEPVRQIHGAAENPIFLALERESLRRLPVPERSIRADHHDALALWIRWHPDLKSKSRHGGSVQDER